MLRIAILAVLLTATSAAAQVTGSIPPTPTLKRSVTVASDLVRIGDLVENAGAKATVPIFRSPDLGHTGAVQAYRVLDAVRAHGIIVVDSRDVVEVVVTRASRSITLGEFEAHVARALAGQYGLGAAENLSVILSREARPIQVEPNVTVELEVDRIAYDPRSSRFDVSFDLPGSYVGRRQALRFTGSVVETVHAAVLVRPVGRGEVVKPTDVTIERRPAGLGRDLVASIDEAVGLAARHALRVGQPLRFADLMKPELVQRNDPVTLVYEHPGLMLTMRGKALESGAAGDIVSVVNVQSKRTVQGVVAGPGRVNVGGATPRVAETVPSQPAGAPRRNE